MRSRAFILAMVVALVVLAVAAVPASAGQQTGIMYGLQSYDVYEFTPTRTGTLTITISWTRPNGTGAPTFPEAEVNGVVQTLDSGEPYYDVDVAELYSGQNPSVGQFSVKSANVNQPIYIGVIPWIGDVPYRLQVTFPTTATTVIDTGPINVANPAQKWAYGNSGELFIPSVGTWLSVLQHWPGTMNRTAGTSDVWANWDDYAWGRDPGTADYELANNWAGLEYYPPVVSTATILASGGAPKTPRPNTWYMIGPQIWTAAARPNVWNNILTDNYCKPGSLAHNAAPLWYTYSWPDAAKPDRPGYFFGHLATSPGVASGRSWSSDSLRRAVIEWRFHGTSFDWVYTTGPRGGIQEVSVDGTPVGTVDQYSATVQYGRKTTFSGFTNAAHTVRITGTGTRNPASLGLFIYHDAFVGKTDPNDVTLRHENNTDGSTVYTWGKTAFAAANGGTFASNKARSAALAFTFNGTAITWHYLKGPKGGISNVYVDGVVRATVDQYAATVSAGHSTVISGLPAGWHTIFIVNAGKNAASAGFWNYHDAFQVGANVIQD